MKEDGALIDLKNQNKLGEVSFFRYTLSVNESYKKHFQALISDIFELMTQLKQVTLNRLFVTQSQEEKVMLMTMQFNEQMLANICIDFSRTRAGYSKKIEVVGTKQMFVFDSDQTYAFSSDCIQKKDFVFTDYCHHHKDWLTLVKRSLQQKQTVFREDV